jgi:triosephosphate isomerase
MAWPRTILLVGLKQYFDHVQSLAWLDQALRIVAERKERVREIELVLVPLLTAIPYLAGHVGDLPIKWGAQNLSCYDYGPHTGEIGGPALAQIGCEYVQIGHSERRRDYGETDEVVAAKVAAAFRNDLIPFLCLGEPEACSPDEATKFCLAQLHAALAQAPDGHHPLVILYEPTWAIGARQPADPAHIRQVCTALRQAVIAADPARPIRIIYGGTAGQQLLTTLGDAVDGLGLGRRAHDPKAFAEILDETLDWARAG